MLSDILKIADDLLDCKDACLMNDITVSVFNSTEHPNTFIIFRVTVAVNKKL